MFASPLSLLGGLYRLLFEDGPTGFVLGCVALWFFIHLIRERQ